MLFIAALVLLFLLLPIFAVKGMLPLWLLMLVVVLACKFCLKRINAYQRAIIFRFGRFHRIAGPGWFFVIPYIEEVYDIVDVRLMAMPFVIRNALTKDDVPVTVSGVVYYRIRDPAKAILELGDYQSQLNTLIASEVRSLISSSDFRTVLSNTELLSEKLHDRIRRTMYRWGIDVDDLEIREVIPAKRIMEAITAKRAAVEELEMRKLLAEARKVALQALGEGAKSLDDRAILYLYLKALAEVGKSPSSKVILPARFFDILQGMEKDIGKSLAGINVSLAVGAIKNLLEKKAAEEEEQ